VRRTLISMLLSAGMALSVLGSATASAAGTLIVEPPPGFKWVGRIIKADFREPLGRHNYKVAMCVANRESNFHPDAYNPNSGASGVFQFIPSTWAWASKAAGYGDHADPFDAKKNIGTAAWVVKGYGWAPWGGGCP
jgi:hypothetical protein